MTEPTRAPTFGERMGALGHEIEDAATRLSRDPAAREAGDTIARAWGLVLIAIGAWFFARTTLGLDMPRIPWSELWPTALIALGALVILRAARRRG